MSTDNLGDILNLVAQHKLSVRAGTEQIETLNVDNLGFANVDLGRRSRTGYPETIFGSGKTAEQILAIAKSIFKKDNVVLCTRVSYEKAKYIKARMDEVVYYEQAKCLVIGSRPKPESSDYIAIVTAGTSDIPVAEEAAVTSETFGNSVKRIYDVGVAGIQRLFIRLDDIQKAKVVIVIAGMEGALASVVGGLVSSPVIAVPTSIGYGSNLHGLSALLTMLNSCAEGVTVVNIDNGFGAAYSASVINQL